MHENREISWSPAGVDDAPSWMVRGGKRRDKPAWSRR
jgi:hypothetical protein